MEEFTKDLTNSIAIDQAGRYPVTSFDRYKYVTVMVDMDTEYINAAPITSRKAPQPFLPHSLGLTAAVEALQSILYPPLEETVQEQRVQNKAPGDVHRIKLLSRNYQFKRVRKIPISSSTPTSISSSIWGQSPVKTVRVINRKTRNSKIPTVVRCITLTPPTATTTRSTRSAPSLLFPLGTIIRRRCENDNMFYEGEVTAYDSINNRYKIKYKEGEIDDFTYEELRKYRKTHQKYRKVLKLKCINKTTTDSQSQHDIFFIPAKANPNPVRDDYNAKHLAFLMKEQH